MEFLTESISNENMKRDFDSHKLLPPLIQNYFFFGPLKHKSPLIFENFKTLPLKILPKIQVPPYFKGGAETMNG